MLLISSMISSRGLLAWVASDSFKLSNAFNFVTTQVNKAGAGDEPASYELCLGVAVSIDVGING